MSNAGMENFGRLSFNDNIMRQKLPHAVYEQLSRTIAEGRRLERRLADTIAHAMKEWAMENGATHYCHWFQPLTGGTAEKHDSFLSLDDGIPLARFSGEQLIQGEPDASSFPNGGIRSTFEARGYTAWDPASPAFLIQTGSGGILTIPSIFVSYYGEALDKKTPLLRSMEMISKAATEVCGLFGNAPKWVKTTLGAEQEYFLVDASVASRRSDLKLCGRTLLGRRSPKDQQLENHYFGTIPDRVLAFMDELDHTLHELGIPAKTRHNEVAPSQYEIACIFSPSNIATDQNLILMKVIRQVARRHNLEAILHEKPFAGVNGSGKHNNWSMMDSNGDNLLEPGRNPYENLRFLFFLTAVIQGVNQNEALIRSAVATSGNDHRLGANEAPPAIMSIFLGKQLTDVIRSLRNGEGFSNNGENYLQTGIAFIPEILQHNTDRNRTSPFAFTGNKFEFRAVGSDQSVAIPQTVINIAVGDALMDLNARVQARMERGESLEHAVVQCLKASLEENHRILFEGNNYGQEWVEEASRRGLSNQPKTPYALKVWHSDTSRALFEKHKILTRSELNLRHEVRLEQYTTKISIEANTLLDLVHGYVLPDSTKWERELAATVVALGAAKVSCSHQTRLLEEVCTRIEALIATSEKLKSELAEVCAIEDTEARACAYSDSVMALMEDTRECADALEEIVPSEHWSLPVYSELLFSIE